MRVRSPAFRLSPENVESDSAFTPREERLRARINAWWFFIGLIFGAFLTAAIALLFLVP